MKQKRTQTYGVCLAVMGMLILGALPCGAQEKRTKKPAPPSISTMQSSSKSKTGQEKPVSPEEMPDVVLADMLTQLVKLSDAHFHEGEWNHTINLNRIIVQGDPQNMDAYANCAWLLWSSDRNEEAVAFLKQGLKANPKTYYFYDELGSHYFIRLRKPAEGIPYYEQATKFKCPSATWHMLAQCYERTKQWEKAVGAWEKAVNFSDDKLAPERLKRARANLAKQQGSKQ